MSKYIDADELLETLDSLRCGHCTNDKSEGCILCQYDDFKKAIGKMPVADVAEVVRCKDCKHNPDNGGECDRSITHTGRDYVCEVNTYRYIGIDYCSYGERREDTE